MVLEERPSSALGDHKSALNPTANEYRFDELKLAMEILDTELRAARLKWHRERGVSVGRTRGILMRF